MNSLSLPLHLLIRLAMSSNIAWQFFCNSEKILDPYCRTKVFALILFNGFYFNSRA